MALGRRRKAEEIATARKYAEQLMEASIRRGEQINPVRVMELTKLDGEEVVRIAKQVQARVKAESSPHPNPLPQVGEGINCTHTLSLKGEGVSEILRCAQNDGVAA